MTHAKSLKLTQQAFAISGIAVALLLVGCNATADDVRPVRGKLTNNGQPLAVKDRAIGLGWVELHFYRIHDDGSIDTDPADAAVEESGEFTVRGRDGRGLPPGKYKITVRQLDPGPDNDKLGGRFSLQNTPLVRQITGEDVIIDLSRPQG